MLDSLESPLRKKSLSALCKICGRQALLPKSLRVPLCYDRSDDALYSGGYSDVWMGEYQGCKVAVKVLRVYTTSNLNKITSVGHSLNFPRAFQGVDDGRVEVLQGSDDMEKSPQPKRAPTIGCDDERQAFCNGIRMDDQWECK